jgi:dolichol-phosphate mannosyltransferase
MRPTIIIPTYNERENIAHLINNIFAIMPNVRILVVDDNSPDGTKEAVCNLQEKFSALSLLPREKKDGLGRAYLAGFRHVIEKNESDAVVMMDADFSHDPIFLSALLGKLNDADLVVGSRYIKGGSTSGWSAWRRLLSYGGNMYCRTIIGLPIKDCTAGYNAIRIGMLKKLDFAKLSATGYAFQIELKYNLLRNGGTHDEVPICFKDRTRGSSKISKGIVAEGIITPWSLLLKRLLKK